MKSFIRIKYVTQDEKEEKVDKIQPTPFLHNKEWLHEHPGQRQGKDKNEDPSPDLDQAADRVVGDILTRWVKQDGSFRFIMREDSVF